MLLLSLALVFVGRWWTAWLIARLVGSASLIFWGLWLSHEAYNRRHNSSAEQPPDLSKSAAVGAVTFVGMAAAVAVVTGLIGMVPWPSWLGGLLTWMGGAAAAVSGEAARWAVSAVVAATLLALVENAGDAEDGGAAAWWPVHQRALAAFCLLSAPHFGRLTAAHDDGR